MKYKTTNKSILCIPENKMEAFRLGTTFGDGHIVYKMHFIEGELESIEIGVEKILDIIEGKGI